MIVAYVSGHGYGHATRTAEVLRTLREKAPRTGLVVVTGGPERLYREAIPPPFAFRSLQVDVGVIQRGPLAMDEAATEARWLEFARRYDELVEQERSWLRFIGARVVLCDIPPLGFSVAQAAGVPAVGLGNFSWDWIYAHLARHAPGLEAAARHSAEAYAHADLLLELPFAGDLSAFPRRERIPLVARRPRWEKGEVRERLRLPGGPLVLISFGGFGLPGFELRALQALRAFDFVVVDDGADPPPNVRILPRDALAAADVRYEELVAAADVVITKPGYGIVSDAIGAGTRLVYTDRGDFPEYPVMVREMPEHLPCTYLPSAEVIAGRWGSALHDVLAQPARPAPDLSGASRAAERLLSYA